MKKRLLSLSILATSFITMNAQEVKRNEYQQLQERTERLEQAIKKQNHLKIGGYLQAETEFGDEFSHLELGNIYAKHKNSIGLRRGYFKASYKHKLAKALMILNITERGVGVVESYFQLSAPWKELTSSSIKMGLFIRPFGYELPYSSSLRESPERSMIIRRLFAEDSDVGAMLTLQADKTSPLSCFKLQTALIAGNGIGRETDSRKDLINHLTFNKQFGKSFHLGLGISHYYGFRKLGNNIIYKMNDGAFKAETTTDEYKLRQYFGFEAQAKLKTSLGLTQLRGEYIFGSQPALKNSSRSPLEAPKNTATYLRDCRGGYLMFVQDLGKLPLSAVLKYDFYDPNTKVSGNDIQVSKHLGEADIMHSAYGLGLLWHINQALRFQAYYQINKNETSSYLAGFEQDRADNILTFRLQYKF